MSTPEDALRAFMRRAAIDFLAEGQVPRLLLPATGRWNTADFFVPSVQLHIEVKGVLTFDSIRKLAGLASLVTRTRLDRYIHNGVSDLHLVGLALGLIEPLAPGK